MTELTPQPIAIDTYGCSRTSKRGSKNGDQFLIAELKRAARVSHASRKQLDHSRRFGAQQAHVLLVANGVNGQPGASGVVIDEVMESILNAVPWTPDLDVESEATLRHELKETLVRCNDHVIDAARRVPASPDMVTTVTMAFVRWPIAFIVHAGDSRAYLIRDGHIEQLTTDHTFAQQLVEDGELDPDAAETTQFANILWNAVGGDNNVTPELSTKILRSSDSLLLCSDGLSRHLSDGAIRYLVESKCSARDACEELIGTVASIGGHDNATVAMARFEDELEQGAVATPPPGRDAAAAAREIPRPAIDTGVPESAGRSAGA